MLRVTALLLCLTTAVSCASAPPGPRVEQRGIYAEEIAGGQFNFHVGQRSMDDSASWGRLSEQVNFGLDFVHGPGDRFLQWDVAFHYSTDEADSLTGPRVTAETFDGSIGLIHFFRFGAEQVVPYIGGGLAGIYVDTEFLNASEVDASDWSFAGYARAGLEFRFRENEHIGIDVRAIGGSSLDMAGVSTNADAIVISMIFGNQY